MNKLILYGAGKVGANTYALLKKKGLEKLVYAFCDRNYHEIQKIDGISVYPYEELRDSKEVFIICMKDNAELVYNQLIMDSQRCYIGIEQWILDVETVGDENGELKTYLSIIDRFKGTVLIRNYFKELKRGESILPDSEVIRLGSIYGGWSIPKKFNAKDKYFLCAGAGEDISFDCELAELFQCKVITMDPTPRAFQHYSEVKQSVERGQNCFTNAGDKEYQYVINSSNFTKIVYYPYGFSEHDGMCKFFFPQNKENVSCSISNLQNTDEYFEAKCLNYKSILKQMNIEAFCLVKLDVEGAEYGAINSIVESGRIPDVLCVDFDEGESALNSKAEKRARDTVEKLDTCGLKPIFIEGNNITFSSERYWKE